MGGARAGLLAAEEPRLSAAVVCYGASPPPEKAARIRCPVLGLYGAEDARILSGVPSFEEAMRRAGGRLETHVYPGAPHAFFNDTRPFHTRVVMTTGIPFAIA